MKIRIKNALLNDIPYTLLYMEEKQKSQVTPRMYVAAQKQPSFVSDTVCSIAEERVPVFPKKEITGMKTDILYYS